jgi:hypothetical protein
VSIDSPPSTDMRQLPALGVEVRDESTLLRSRLTLASNWFSVSGLQITRRKFSVRLYRAGRLIACSAGGDMLLIPGHRLEAQKTGRFWRPVWVLPLDEGRSAEISLGKHGVYRHVRVSPGDVRLDAIDLSRGFGRACRINLVSGLMDTEVALRLLVYFLAELEEAYRHTS